jgi:hypothetical protein
MSASSNILTVETADTAAEISVLDGSLNNVGRSVGRLRKELPRGIYKVRVRVGPSFQEQLVSLDQDREIKVDALAFASPIPLTGTSRSHEYHQAAAIDASRNARTRLGSGASVMVFAREWSAPDGRSQSNPAAGLTFCDESGGTLAVVADKADVRTSGDASAGWRADVAPGAYRLRLEFSDGSGLERSLFATSGKQTQVFLLQRDQVLPDGKVDRRADLLGATVTISPSQSFNPQDRRVRLSELACYALTQSRRILSDEVMDELLNEKFEDPMLGLLGAHLILHDNPKGLSEQPDALRQFKIVTDNLLRLLGPDHPDLQTLWWRRGDGGSIGDGRLHSLPMLRRSWDLAVEKSFQKADAIALQSACNAAIAGIRPAAPWLVWRAVTKDSTSAEAGALFDVLGDYLHARALAAGSRVLQSVKQAVPSGGKVRGKSFAARATKAADPAKRAVRKLRSKVSTAESLQAPAPGEPGILTSLESAVATVAASVLLDHDEKADIARTLGVPSQMLDAMLRRFSP